MVPSGIETLTIKTPTIKTLAIKTLTISCGGCLNSMTSVC